MSERAKEKDALSRRAFIKKAAATAAGITVAWHGTKFASPQAVGANERVSLGFIGVGGRGTLLLRTTVALEGVRVPAVCDLREARMRRAMDIASKFGARGYLDFREMLDKEKLDGVVVATEVGNHAKVVVPVLERDLHCFSEKPMDCTVEKVDQITRAARKSKGIYQIGFQRRYIPGYHEIIGRIQQGEFGEIVFLQGMWHWGHDVGGWVADVNMSGGPLVEQACHHMDVMTWVLGGQHPLRAAAAASVMGNQPGRLAESNSAVIYQFPNGINFSYTHLHCAAKPHQGDMERVYAERAGIDIPRGVAFDRRTGKEIKLYEGPLHWGAGTKPELEAFIEGCRTGKTPFSNVETGRVSTLMAILGRKAMYNAQKGRFEIQTVTWEDLGSTTEPEKA